MRVLLIDDHALFRRGMRLMLIDLWPGADISEAESCQSALRLFPEHFDLILMDWHMPGMQGFEALQQIKKIFPVASLAVVSSEEDSGLIRQIIATGASGFIPKSSEPSLMIGALNLILSNGIYLPPQVLQGYAPRSEFSSKSSSEQLFGITDRQAQILQAALKGMPNKLIGRKFDISEGTVKSHLSSVYRAMNVRNRTEALYAMAKRVDGKITNQQVIEE
ncbi:MAG: hypothetical protein RL018_1090 [Pseudomonadota bacterium]